MSNVEISVIMPAYNAEKFIEESIECVLNQTYQNFELLIIDDHPTDNTMKVVEKFRDERIRVIHNPTNKGVSYSRNVGLDMCQGDYIVMMDDDDTMPLNRLELQLNYLKQNMHIDAVGGKTLYMDEKGRITGTFNRVVLNNPKFIRAKLLETNVFINSAVMYRRSVIEENHIRYWDNSYGLEDYIFLLEFSKYGNISGIDEVVHLYRQHGTNTLQKIFKEQAEERRNERNKVYHFAYSAEGFKLSEEQYNIILEAFKEGKQEPTSFKVIADLMLVFDEILNQAKALELDNIDELTRWMVQCRRSLW